MKTMIDNLINGNLTTARQQAKRVSLQRIVSFLQDEYGWTLAKAYAAANYLKTGTGFQAYCDAE